LRAITKSLIRGNKPLGASMISGGGVGLRSADIQKWIAEVFGQPSRPSHLQQYSLSVPVYFAVKLRADAVARAPMKAYKTTSRGELEWVGPNHRVQRHLDKVNPWWSHSDMWRGVETYLALYGSSFKWVDRSGSVDQWEEWLLRPDKVVVVKDRERYIKGFIYDPHGANFPMMPDEVIWDRYFNPLDEFSGMSPLEPLWREILPMRQDMIRSNRALFKNGVLSQNNLAFLLKGPLSTDQVEAFYARLEQRHMGAANANRPLIVDLTSGSVDKLGFSNREMEWMEGVKWAAGDTLTALGVREELYPGSQRTTYHNLSEALQDFYRNTISSEWELLESGMNERFRPMLPPSDQGLVFKFDTTVVGAMQESINEKSNRELNEVRAGTLTPDEYRGERGRPPLEDGMGAKPYVSAGTLPLAGVGGQGSQAQTNPPPRMIEEVRCPTCRGITGKMIIQGSQQYCRKCELEFVT